MKIALCFSGHIRDLNESKTFWTELIKKYDIDVYASFWDIENPELGDTINEFEKIYSPKRLEVESYDVFKKTTQDISSLHIKSPDVIANQFQESSEAFHQLSMCYKIWKCNLLTKQLGVDYDIVVRARIDSLLDSNFEFIINDMLNVPMGVNSCPSFPNSEGINDCFAFGNPKVMDYYSFLFLQLMNYLNEGHYLFPPEHLLAVHFSKVKIQIRYFPNYILLLRKWKGSEHEIYNKFVNPPEESFRWSDSIQFIPEPHLTFKKESIVTDFIV
jgi:hypothetical protein